MQKIFTSPIRGHQQRGFTLIEVLITVIILAIGLLGLAGLQFSGLRFTHSAYQRSQATILTNDILDRMRVNRRIAENGAYDIALGAAPAAANCTGLGIDCNPANMARADLSEWKNAIATMLPAGDGSVRRNGSAFVVTIQWNDTRGVGAPIELTVESVL
ncbi:MAG: type IV pilus modification protein PilV [Chromatiales bacterium]|nr:type IV pilus modification protein PilV [Chromatiales bacterium]